MSAKRITSSPAGNVTGYPLSGYDGTDASFEALQDAAEEGVAAELHATPVSVPDIPRMPEIKDEQVAMLLQGITDARYMGVTQVALITASRFDHADADKLAQALENLSADAGNVAKILRGAALHARLGGEDDGS